MNGSRFPKHAATTIVAFHSPPIFAPCATSLMTALREIIIIATSAAFVA
jgi:hypothetical protein